MEMMSGKGFVDLSEAEMERIDGGTAWGAAVAVVALAGGALVGGFQAGRQFVKDIRNKWF